MAIDISTMEIDNNEECLKKEVFFKINSFKNTITYESFPALALKLQDLLLMEPGTHPGAIDMGVGIKNYLMELNDSDTISNLQAITIAQINKYLPSSDIKTVEYIINKELDNRNSLYIVVYLNKTAEEFEANVFAMGISNVVTTKTDLFPAIYV